MNREIKFRGKRIDNGEWVYGWYYEAVNYLDGNTKPMIAWINQVPSSIDRMIPAFEPIEWEVIPKTIGQYTGLKDKNGKDIYEGDIIKNTLGHLEKIVFNNGCFQAASIKHPNANLYLLSSYNDYIEIIGSIFENPKLLEVENEQK